MSEKGEWVCNDVKNFNKEMFRENGWTHQKYLKWRSQFIVGDPQPTPDGKEYTKEDLIRMGLVGLYRKL